MIARVLFGTPDAIRTHDLQSRSLTLYPAELRALVGANCAPFRPPCGGHSFRSVAPPLQNKSASLGFVLAYDGGRGTAVLAKSAELWSLDYTKLWNTLQVFSSFDFFVGTEIG